MTDIGGRSAARARRRRSGGGSRSYRARTPEEIMAAQQARIQARWRSARVFATHMPFNIAAFAGGIRAHDWLNEPAAATSGTGSVLVASLVVGFAAILTGLYAVSGAAKSFSWKAATYLAALGAIGSCVAADMAVADNARVSAEAPTCPDRHPQNQISAASCPPHLAPRKG